MQADVLLQVFSGRSVHLLLRSAREVEHDEEACLDVNHTAGDLCKIEYSSFVVIFL
jgi:hypothetical protein